MSSGLNTKFQDTAAAQQMLNVKDSAVQSAVDSSISEKRSTFRFTDTEDTLAENQDSTAVVGPAATLEGPGIFKGHQLQVKHQNAQTVTDFVSDWFTLTLIALVGLFTWFRFFYYRIFKQLVSAYFNLTATNQIVRDESVLLQRASLVLSVISYLLAGLFLYQVSIQMGWTQLWLQKGLMRFVLLAIAVASAYSLKMIALRFMSIVFSQERPVALYIFNIFLMIMMVGLILLPVNILLAFSSSALRGWIIGAAAVLIGTMFLYRLIRAVGIWIGLPGFSFFYLFLYLCAFEIAPLLIIYKLATL
ncbi:hypothetical protein BH11BAC2_BH11BAC2_24800 [soil metagenome]